MNPDKSLDTSFKHLDSSSVNKNQLNNSSSKMQYSFPKSSRFSEERKVFSPNKFYDVPGTTSKRSTSFGFGNKLDLSKQNFVTPPPGRYNANSDFNPQKSHGFTMAPGRNVVKANDMFYRSLKHSPQPATYSPKPLEKSLKFSMHPRLQDKSDKWKKNVPGPGSYSHLELVKQDGKSMVAKHESSKLGKFDKLPRLSEVQMKKNRNPGPNQYKNTAQISNEFKFSKKGGNVFSRSARQGIVNKSFTPGPGNYNFFSEFV